MHLYELQTRDTNSPNQHRVHERALWYHPAPVLLLVRAQDGLQLGRELLVGLPQERHLLLVLLLIRLPPLDLALLNAVALVVQLLDLPQEVLLLVLKLPNLKRAMTKAKGGGVVSTAYLSK